MNNKYVFMRKLILIISSLFVLLTSCNSGNKKEEIHKGFTIYGALPISEASLVYLLNEENKKIDSATITSNNFHFKGFVTSPKEYQLQVQNQSKKHKIFLENSNYTVVVNNDKTTISGGDLNTKQFVFNDLRSNLDTKKLVLLDSFMLGNIKSDSLYKSILAIESDLKKITTEYIITNANTPLSSTFLLEIESQNFNLEELKNILNNSEVANTKVLKSILDNKIAVLQKNVDDELAEKKKLAVAKKIYRKPAIMFSGDGLNRELISLESVIKGKKAVLVDFWASWCGPCRVVTPRVRDIYNKYKNKGFTILTISEDKSREDWKKGIEQDNMLSWYHIFDDYGRISSMYGVRAIPYMVLIDGQGRVIKEKISVSELESQLQKIL